MILHSKPERIVAQPNLLDDPIMRGPCFHLLSAARISGRFGANDPIAVYFAHIVGMNERPVQILVPHRKKTAAMRP